MPARDSARAYRLRAQHCLDIARDMESVAKKMTLLDMAQAWMLLADQAERNGAADLVYETPLRKPAVAASRGATSSQAGSPPE